jgi:hypothetical protein
VTRCGGSPLFKDSPCASTSPVIIIDEDFRSENTSGLGIRALAEAIEKEGWKCSG